MLFKACCSNPPRRVLWVRLNKRVKEHACTLNVANLCVGFKYDRVEGCEVALRVDGARYTAERCCRAGDLSMILSQSTLTTRKGTTDLVKLERKNFITSLSNLNEIRHRARVSRCLKATGLITSMSYE
jgi:hypothetical protein